MKYLLKNIPKIDKFIANERFKSFSKDLILKISKEEINLLRSSILAKEIKFINENNLIDAVIEKYKNLTAPSLKHVINATGIIVHTNLGRSLIDKETLKKAMKIGSSYNNLEYNLKKGERGERYSHIIKTLKALTNCEDALIVNNNASAVFLILNTFAKNKETIVSRSELVEIGGSFRIPDVMTNSGTILKEIGTTNKSHIKDYENAINENTSMLMKVHKSNYTIEGFFSEVNYKEIIDISNKNNLIDYYDMGSGHIIDLPGNLNKNEPSILEIMKYNPSLLSFSGDKLLGSIQAGIIIGKKHLIEKLKENQLLRMLRVDKLTLCILENTFNSYLKKDYNSIPTLRMLFTKKEILEKRALLLKNKLDNICICEIIETKTMVGGGTTPNKKINSIGLTIEYKNFKANKIETLLRENNLITRIENDKVILDFKTIQEDELEEIFNIFRKVFI